MTRRWACLVIGLTVVCGIGADGAESQKPNLNDLIHETQYFSSDPDRVVLIWWIPAEYWRVAMEADPNVTEQQIEEVVRTVSPYVLVAIADGKMGAMAAVTYRPEQETRRSLQFKDSSGGASAPLDDDDIDPALLNLVGFMRPVLANMLGPMGKNLHFYAFRGTDGQGNPLVNATREGEFTIVLGDVSKKWRTPLSALVPRKTCPKCNESLSGSFKFCPWDGTGLREPIKRD